MAASSGRASDTSQMRISGSRGRPGCSQRGAVDPGGVQPGGPRDRDRRGRVPLVLAAAVHVGVDLAADHRGDLGPGRAHRDQVGAQLLGQRRGQRRRPGAADHEPGPARHRRRRARPARRCSAPCPGPAARPRPRSARRAPTAPRARPSRCGQLAELAGAVQRVDDPDPARRTAGRGRRRLPRTAPRRRAAAGPARRPGTRAIAGRLPAAARSASPPPARSFSRSSPASAASS